jgi:hypothetical protein
MQVPEDQMHVPPKSKCRSFDSAEQRFAQDDGFVGGVRKSKCRSFDSAEKRFAQDDSFVGWVRENRYRSFDSAEQRFAQDDSPLFVAQGTVSS